VTPAGGTRPARTFPPCQPLSPSRSFYSTRHARTPIDGPSEDAGAPIDRSGGTLARPHALASRGHDGRTLRRPHPQDKARTTRRASRRGRRRNSPMACSARPLRRPRTHERPSGPRPCFAPSATRIGERRAATQRLGHHDTARHAPRDAHRHRTTHATMAGGFRRGQASQPRPPNLPAMNTLPAKYF